MPSPGVGATAGCAPATGDAVSEPAARASASAQRSARPGASHLPQRAKPGVPPAGPASSRLTGRIVLSQVAEHTVEARPGDAKELCRAGHGATGALDHAREHGAVEGLDHAALRLVIRERIEA